MNPNNGADPRRGCTPWPTSMMGAFVDVKHFAAVLRLADVEHLARTDGTSAVRVVSVAQGFHFNHVFARNGLVAAFVEEDAGIVAVVDDGIAHQLRALFPLTSLAVFLGVARGHGLNQPHAVARFDVLFPRRHVHPAHEVGVALDHQPVAVIAQPCRNTHADGGPFVRGTLGEAFELQHAVVEPDLAFGEAGFAESGAGFHGIDYISRTGVDQLRYDVVEITVAPTPKVQSLGEVSVRSVAVSPAAISTGSDSAAAILRPSRSRTTIA